MENIAGFYPVHGGSIPSRRTNKDKTEAEEPKKKIAEAIKRKYNKA